MNDFENIICFDNLYKAYRRARLGKRHKREVIEFEMHLGENLWALHMDDCILLVNDTKENIVSLFKKLKTYIEKEELIVNPKSQIIPISKGLSFLGWNFSFSKTGKIIQSKLGQSKKRILNKVKYKKYLLDKGKISKDKYKETITSYENVLSKGNEYHFKKKLNFI